MKKIALVAGIMLFAFSMHAQKYAIIDTRYILDKIPAYTQAQKQLDDIAADWQKDIDARQLNLDKMYKDFDAEQVMLSDDLKKKRQDQLFVKKKNLGICSVNGLVLKAISLKKTGADKADTGQGIQCCTENFSDPGL